MKTYCESDRKRKWRNYAAILWKPKVGSKLMSKSRIVVRSILCCAAIVGLLMTVPMASAETTLQKIKRTGTMTAGNTFNYPPFHFIANGEKVGFDVDIGNDIARRMGVKLEWETIDFRGIIAALKSGRVDITTGMIYTPDRAKQIAFSIPYYDGGIAAAYPNGKPVSKPDELVGKRVGVELGSEGEKFVRDKIGPHATVKTYDSEFLGLKDLSDGRLDAFVGNVVTMRYIMLKMPSFKISPVWAARVQGINTRLQDKDLLAEINKQLSAMKNDGTYKKVVAKWFGH
jgi:ABC-type amino acid transport substrate-binding protein